MLVLAKKSLFLARKRRLFVLNSLLGFLSVRFRKCNWFIWDSSFVL